MYQYSSLVETQWEHLPKVFGSEQLSYEPIKSPFNIVNNPLQTPSSFCSSSTINLVNFQPQQYDQINVPDWCFEFPKTTTSETYTPMMFSQQACGDNFTNNTKQDPPLSQLTSSLHSVAESFLSSSVDSHSSQKDSDFDSYAEKYSNFQPQNISFYEHLPQENDELLKDDGATDEKTIEISFKRNQLSSSTKTEKQHPQPHGVNCVTSSNSHPTCKRRIRWTNDLHESFMIIVNRLGGPEKAKPKAILEEMMKLDNLLSISHIKSHLQVKLYIY
ncbi:putative transcription factor MYB-HB-like family [Lupinus albus]|uniref:Putative transcription factor MYB-HB-like family n=1 Tax=Lupinus albus TaxID=3870 RepID=A0A6A4P8L4_LUPAL|nr:putative transcription factor MYB-HB-like family [Lupinus albus]